MRVLSILLGAIFVAWIAQGLHSNPRWTWAPGEGELPRDVVSLYMNMVYENGQIEEAEKLFYSPDTKDSVPADRILPNGKTFTPKVIRVIAEGFDVAVQFSANDAHNESAEFMEIYHVVGGRITSRERIVNRSENHTAAKRHNDIEQRLVNKTE